MKSTEQGDPYDDAAEDPGTAWQTVLQIRNVYNEGKYSKSSGCPQGHNMT
jgi:hypothetical protein